MDAEQAYLASLKQHITNVQTAGRELGVKEEQLEIHDQSKYTIYEFSQYAKYFWNDDGTPKKPEQRTILEEYNFTISWKHHLQVNRHHWQSWIFPDQYAPKNMVKGGYITPHGVLQMPERYALEMIADWMGASMSYQDTWWMGPWLERNMKRIVLHPKTVDYVKRTLIEVDSDYYQIMLDNQFKYELG